MTSAATQTLWVPGIDSGGTSLVARWLEVQLPTQGTWVRSLVLELRSHTSGPLATLVAMRQLSPCSATKEATTVWSPCTATREAPLFTVTRESPCRKEELNKDPAKKENKNKNHSLGNNWKKKKKNWLWNKSPAYSRSAEGERGCPESQGAERQHLQALPLTSVPQTMAMVSQGHSPVKTLFLVLIGTYSPPHLAPKCMSIT